MLISKKTKSIKKFNNNDRWLKTSLLFNNRTYWSIRTISHKENVDPNTIPNHKWHINVGSEKYIKRLWKKET